MSTSKTTFNPLLKRGFQIVSTTAETIADVTKEPTGWEDGDNITHTYSHTDRKVTLTHPSGTLAWWWKGVRHTVASPWVSDAHANTPGSWFLKLTGDISTANWALNTPWKFYEIQVFLANYQTLAVDSWGLREAHGLMPWQAHEELHAAVGTYWVSGLTLDPATYTLNGTTDAQNAYGVLAGSIKDEDATTPIAAWAEGTYTIGYRNGVGGAWVFSTTETLPFIVAANTIRWNQNTAGTWSNAVTTEDNFVNYFDFCLPVSSDSDSQKYRHLLIPGQSQFTTLAAAQQEFPQNLDLGTLTDLSPEFVCVNRITYQFNASGAGSKTTTGRCAIQSVSVIRGSRASQIAASGASPSDHGGLSGLADDDHLQYEHINGRAAQVDTKGVNFAADANIGVYYVDTSGGNITATLPDPATYPGKMFLFVNKSTNNITFAGYTVGGISNFTIDGNERLMIHSDGAAWRNVLRKPMAYWKTGITFCKDHIIESSETGWEGIWRCVNQHTAAAAFSTDIQAGKWDYMGGDRSALFINKAGHGFATTNVLARDFGTVDWELSAPNSNDNKAVGVVAGATTDYFLLVTAGYIKRTSGTWTANVPYYLNTAGALTDTKQTSGFARRILVTTSTTEAIVGIGELEYFSGAPSSVDTIAAGDTISPFNVSAFYPGWNEQWHAVVGSATGQNAMSSTPFGAAAPAVPVEIWLVGTDNTKTVTIATNDAQYGAWVAGDFIEIGKGTVIGFRWIPYSERWVEICRNNAVIS